MTLQADLKGRLRSDWRGKRVLVSAGPTQEPLDSVRLISNRSSGRMGVLLAQAARFRGAQVDLVHGPLTVPLGWLEGLNCLPAFSSAAMEISLLEHQPGADAVLMCAAVADVRRQCLDDGTKLPKGELMQSIVQGWELVPDLLKRLGMRRPSGQRLLGFAALAGDDQTLLQRGREKIEAKGCDLMMVNPIDRPNQGLDSDLNGGWLLGPGNHQEAIPAVHKLVLAHHLLDRLSELGNQAAMSAGP